MLPPRYAIAMRATPAMAERPEHRPSRPSLRLAPLLVAMTKKTVTRRKMTHPPISAALPPIHSVSQE